MNKGITTTLLGTQVIEVAIACCVLAASRSGIEQAQPLWFTYRQLNSSGFAHFGLPM